VIKNIGVVHQNFLPVGLLGASKDNPYKLDVAKAKALLAKAGVPNGFKVTIDMRTVQPVQGITEAIQQTFKQAGIELEILPGDGKQTLTKYRARTHDIYIGSWGADYWDPHTNADTFARNPTTATTRRASRWPGATPGTSRADRQGRRGGAGTRRRQARQDVPGDPGRVPRQQPLRDALPADRRGGLSQQCRWAPDRADVRFDLHVRGGQALVL
jgi:peptide/nickel transport system substrate-binding protein